MKKPVKRAVTAGLTKTEINDATMQMLRRYVVQLSEHLTSIQVVATKLENDGTTTVFSMGSGDLFARRMAAIEWVDRQKKD